MSSTHRRLLLALIILTAALLRFWRLDSLPPGFHLDESFEGLEAWRILVDATYRPLFLTGNFGVPPLNAYANALMFRLFLLIDQAPGPFAMRTTAACLGTVGVITLYGLANEFRRFPSGVLYFSPLFPFFAAATVAVMRWHIHFSRMGIEPIFVPLLWSASTWLLLHGWRTKRWLSFIGSGVLLAAGIYAYRGAWVIPFLFVLVVGCLLIERWRHGQLAKNDLIGVALCAGVAALLFAPLGLLFLRNPELLLLRLNQLNIVGNTGSPADNSVWNSLWAMSKMFGPFGAPGDADPRRNLPGAPALNGWLALPFYLGCLLAFWRIQRPIYAITLIGLFGLLAVNVFSEYAPHFHRVLGATAPVALLCGMGLDWLWQSPLLRKAHLAWLSLLLLLIGAGVEARDYFVRWANLPDLYYAFDVGLWQIAQDTAAQPADTQIYLTPRTWTHPTLAFAWATTQTHPGAPVSFDGRHIFPVTDQAATNPELYVVIAHEDFRTPLLLPELLPAATIQQTLQDAQGTLYAYYYVRSPHTISARPPQHQRQSVLGDGITLAGYDVQPTDLQPGGILYLQLHWLVTAPPRANWTVFTHLLATDAAGKTLLVAGQDNVPGAGSLPTTEWRPGWRVLDEYQLSLPADLPAGDYKLAIGLYQATGERLPNEEQGLSLGTVAIP